MKRLIPTPRDGWRVFAGEVGVIVLGVLIALAAQQVADEWQWRQKTARAKADLNDQIGWAIVQASERKAIDRCQTGRLKHLVDRVAASDGRWNADPWILPGAAATGESPRLLPYVYLAPARPYPDDLWEQTKAAGVLAHMSAKTIEDYTYAFFTVNRLSEGVSRERQLSSELSFLAFDGRLDMEGRARALNTLATLEEYNSSILTASGQLVGYARSLGVALTAANEKELAEYLDLQRRRRGACVDEEAAHALVAPLRRR